MESQLIKVSRSINIDASAVHLWEILLNDLTYRKWAAVFHPGSYAQGTMEKGSLVHFKSPEGSGIESQVIEHIPAERIKFLHLNLIENHKVAPDNKESEKWRGATEEYLVRKAGDLLIFQVNFDITPEYEEYFTEKWEEALGKIKQLAEA